MKIGMMYAMDGEIESLLKNENAHLIEKVSGASFYQIRENVVACAGGVGKVNAAMSTQLLLSRYAPDGVLNVGVAGCFENVPIGTLVLATGFVQHDSDTSALGDPVGLVSTVNKVEFPTAWPEKARAAEYDGPMPGCSAAECGNYRNLSVEEGRACCARYRDLIASWTEEKLVYPAK